jgi:hypothetical protein
MILAEFAESTTLQAIIGNARWAGAPSQEELQREYFRGRMWEAVRRLPHSEDVLAAVLAEIIEEMEAATAS